jgi:hypothetical protein
MMRAPLAPSGCPLAIAPPLTFVLARSAPVSFAQAVATRTPLEISTPLLPDSQRLAMGHKSFRSGSASSFGAVNNGPRSVGGEPATHIVA